MEDARAGATSRRKFLGTAAGATGVALAAVAWRADRAAAAVPDTSSRYPSPERAFVAGKFALSLDGANTGFLKSVDGGNLKADVITEQAGATFYQKKHLGQIKYEDFTMQLGLAMNKAVYDWISASWTANFMRKNGAVVAADFTLEAKSERQFMNALITETGIPAMDGASKEPAYLTLKITPEFTRDVKASGKLQITVGKDAQQKVFLPSNFRLEIDGLDCTHVNKIDAFTVKQAVVTDDIGEARDYVKEPGKLEFPNLRITMAQTGAASWYAWHEDFVIKGNNSEEQEKGGTLTFLSPNRQSELAAVHFFNLGIFKLAQEKSESNADTIPRVTAELYCERMEFEYKGGTIR